MDQLPLDGRITDLRAFARLGEEGVDLFLTDSTNAEVPGFTTSEKSIGPVLDRVFREQRPADHRRLLRLPRAPRPAGARRRGQARPQGRRTSAARWCATWASPATSATSTCRPACWSTPRTLADMPPERQVLISTGSQGEPMSALSRIAQRNHNFVHIEEGDTVVLASSPDPRQRERRLPRDQRPDPARAPTSCTRATRWSTSPATPAPVSCSTATTSSSRATCCRCTARSGTCWPTPQLARATGVPRTS